MRPAWAELLPVRWGELQSAFGTTPLSGINNELSHLLGCHDDTPVTAIHLNVDGTALSVAGENPAPAPD